MTGIFLSYRREDTQGWVGRLAGVVRAGFPRTRVFHDIATIRPGEDFVASIEDALASCQAVLAIMGPRWLTIQTPEGRRRIDDPTDLVRLEVERSLARPVRLVPVLFGGAAMPKVSDLPDQLRPLAHRQAHEISDKRWDYDCNALLTSLGDVMGGPPVLEADRGRGPRSPGISVGHGLTVTNSQVGDIAGVKMSGATHVDLPESIDIMRNAHAADSEIGDIAGVLTENPE